ncbi:MAG: Hint domain-containing protein, partial [Selenomonas sp.]|nr:Hint domain-containing protein [Selenomonas sp.]
NGWLMANSGNSIYVHQNGNMLLTLLSAAAGMDAYLRADNGIRMYNGYGMDMGYINAGRTVDLYTKHGDIDDVRILANGAVVNAKAMEGTVKLKGIGGELPLGEIVEKGRIVDIEAKAREWKIEELVDAYKEAAREYAEYLKENKETIINAVDQYLVAGANKKAAKEAYLQEVVNKFLLDKGYSAEAIAAIKEYAFSGADPEAAAAIDEFKQAFAQKRKRYGYSDDDISAWWDTVLNYTGGKEALDEAGAESRLADIAKDETDPVKKAEKEAAKQKEAEEAAKAAEEVAKQKAEPAWQEAEASLMQQVDAKVAEYEALAAAIDDLLANNSEVRSSYNAYKEELGEPDRQVSREDLFYDIARAMQKEKGVEFKSFTEVMGMWLYAKGGSTEMKEAGHALLTEIAKQKVQGEGQFVQQVAAQMAQEAKEKQASLEAETTKYLLAQFTQDAANIAAQKAAAKAAAQKAAEEAAAKKAAEEQKVKQSCFTADSPVATPKGERPISELAVGDEVITLDCNGREIVGTVTEVMTPREEEIVEVTFSNGTVWHTTESQTIWLGHEQNYEIKDDAVGRPALVRGGESIAITSVKYTGKYETVYDVLIGEEEDEDVIFVAGIAAEGYFTRGERGLS